ncbi:MAG: hypothetical protein RIR26_1927 [Pseudomonadota bacterium]
MAWGGLVFRFLSLLFVLTISCSKNNEYATAPKAAASKRTMGKAAGESAAAQTTQSQARTGNKTAPQKLFNAAILTQSVQCLFCHMRVEGDVGGLHFPSDSELHPGTGTDLKITGTLFATNDIPSLLSQMDIASAYVSNYKNSGLKVFPTTKNAAGEIVFPEVRKNLISGKTKGTLKLGSTVIENQHSGHLTLVASQQPIEVSGEVFIDGDLIIGGPYTGLGTVYARNIFIAKDLKGTHVPFPFSTDPKEAQREAQTALSEKKDGLYLFALGQITVGFPDRGVLKRKSEWHSEIMGKDGVSVEDPPISISAYKALGEKKHCSMALKLDADSSSVLVNQVDAFLYASDYLLWRTCDGYVLNGGFVSPHVALLSGADQGKNVIRYDYRLRAGVQAFSLLKEFFEKD